MVRRMRSSSFRKMSPDPPRFMRFRTRALACCSGMSMYFTSAMRGDGVEQALGDLVGIGVEEADPFFAGASICARRSSRRARPSARPRSSP
jgi:hypothetical protein